MTEGRSILRLSASAFIVLAAEPSFVLVDTAVVGHLGATPLAGLGVGGTLVSLVAMIGAFLDYGTTGRAARWFGAGDRSRAVDEGVVATVLALILGVIGAGVGELAAGPLVHLLAGGNQAVYRAAVGWFRIAVLGLPGVLVILAGNGWMRGVQDTRRPVRIVLAANVASAIASPLLVYPAGFGLDGSAVANIVAQTVGGLLFLRAVHAERRPWRPQWPTVRAQMVVGRDLLLREIGFQAAFMCAAGVATRMGTAQIAAHQIGYQLWNMIALLLDSFAIAAQSLVGAALGSGDAAAARHTAARVARYGLLAGFGTAVVLAAGWSLIPEAFTSSAAVRHQAHLLWPFFVGMQPAAGVLFALDGVLIGAGDVGFMRTLTLFSALAVFVPLTVAALHFGWGIEGVWAGLTGFILTRLVGMIVRSAGTRWMVVGT
ncbi:MAG TPA: MATE family efflux transporter [Acidimicrobiales bacterium]|jgi:putative MATE family efflux protein|nr:MATE family efflux transporter [Acidimicrobiales bacterium]